MGTGRAGERGGSGVAVDHLHEGGAGSGEGARRLIGCGDGVAANRQRAGAEGRGAGCGYSRGSEDRAAIGELNGAGWHTVR